MKGLHVELVLLAALFVALSVGIAVMSWTNHGDDATKAFIGWCALLIGAIVGIARGQRPPDDK